MKPKLNFGLVVLLVLLYPIMCNGQNLLNAPQKIVIDKKPGRIGYTRNRLLVSNFNGGSIIEIDTLGNQSYFIQGAGFIDGLEVVGNKVYGVGASRKVIGYDLDTKQQVLNLTLEGVADDYLSSVCYDSLGHIFISCPNLHAIYKLRLSDYSYWIFAQGNGLNRPNGILLEKEKDRIVVIDDSPGSSIIHGISLVDSTVTTLATTDFDRPDGITRDKHGYYYVGGYYLPGLYQFDPDFSSGPRMIFSGTNMVYPTYDPDDHSLLITYYGDNSWDRVPLTTVASSSKMTQIETGIFSVYPNPSGSTLNIRFELERYSNVKLEVYNSNGTLVNGVINKALDQGLHEVRWERKGQNGRIMPKGIYYCVLKTDQNKRTQKVILID